MHIKPDWLLLYRIDGDEVQLARTGMHSDLFRKQQPRSGFCRRLPEFAAIQPTVAFQA